MLHASHPGSIDHLVGQQQPASDIDRGSFAWSQPKIRLAAFLLVAVAAPEMAVFAVAPPGVQWACVAALVGVVLLMSGLSRRALADTIVLTIDQYGILDRRLLPRRITWQEITAICPVDMARNHTVDIELRWPQSTLGKTRWSVRMGIYCQMAYGVPALSISMLLLDGSVSDLLAAIAQFRPDLLDAGNRRALTTP
jgi:hypothetical protein